MRSVALVLALLGLLVSPVWAEEDMGVWLTREEAADLFGRAGENQALMAKIAALEATIDLLQKRDAIREEIERLKDAKLALQEELTDLARQEAAHWKALAEDTDKRARRDVKIARVQGWAATGAFAGSVAMPGVGTLIGAAVGALIGWVMP